ncbi:MAG: hypothetical protein U5P10_13590 [Spirochaetia bacterium]|nr:hypothetical protein [Spirochaetia bacterium]
MEYDAITTISAVADSGYVFDTWEVNSGTAVIAEPESSR